MNDISGIKSTCCSWSGFGSYNPHYMVQKKNLTPLPRAPTSFCSKENIYAGVHTGTYRHTEVKKNQSSII